MLPEGIAMELAAEKKCFDELFAELKSSKQGLTAAEASKRLAQFGPNTIEEKKESLLLKFVRYFWGPLPWLIEVAALLSGLLRHWDDCTIIIILLLVNGLITFFEEHEAGNAIEALKKKLALKAIVLRDGK